jgi:hypothetical protein
LGFARVIAINALAHLQGLEGADMVLLLDVLQVDALNDHGWVFGLQVGIGTKPSNLRAFSFF